MKTLTTIITLLAVVFLVNSAFATDTETITAWAIVPSLNPTFSISIIESLTTTTYDWDNAKPASAGMNFGTLTNTIAGDSTSDLTATKHFLVLLGVTSNSGVPYSVTYEGAPLAKTGDPTTVLSGDAWTVAADVHYDPNTTYPAGLTTGIRSAEDTYVVYNSNGSGVSDTIRLYFGITGDSANAAGANLIPATQPAGTYSGTVRLTVSP